MKLATERALNRLAKWRTVFAGWQLGTRPDSDPECQAVRDTAEARLVMRAELNALVALLQREGVIGPLAYEEQLEVEAERLCQVLEARFPGFEATDLGMKIDVRAVDTMQGWKP